MPDDEPLLSISSYARLVGLSPSALRFYDDCGLLRPAQVDPRSGYRLYAADQQRTGALVRRLREIDLPLHEIRAVLHGPPAETARILRRHATLRAGLAEQARDVAEDVIAAFGPPGSAPPAAPTVVVVGGPELASAVRQVSPAAARRADVPALTGVLLEVTHDELVVVATDRYWMAVRALPMTDVDGPPRRLLVPADQLSEVAAWSGRQLRVRLRVDESSAVLTGDADERVLDVVGDGFPNYRDLLAALPPVRARTLVDRLRLLEIATATDPDAVLVLDLAPQHLDIRLDNDRHGIRLPAAGSGEPTGVAFAPVLLGAALAASVGPDVLIELTTPDRAAVVRSADQGSFTTLVMPIRRDSGARTP